MKLQRLATMITGLALAAGASLSSAKDIVHDAEYYVLKAQHGERWAMEDKSLDAKLAELTEHPFDQLLTAVSLESHWRMAESLAECGSRDREAVERQLLREGWRHPSSGGGDFGPGNTRTITIYARVIEP